jgi:glycosyltransferase involved in cell wall biosynthesis
MTIKRRILLVSNGFYPELSPRSFRATELAKEFYRQGHEVVVVSKYREHDYSDFLNEFPVTFKMWGKSRFPIVPSIKNRRLGLISRGLSRFLLLLFEYPGIEDMFHVKKALRNENGYDLMISFAAPYPIHWGVAWARTAKHTVAKIWVADCGDPYMLDTNDSFGKPFYFRYFEKLFGHKADFITIPREEMKKYYYKEFHNKIRIIPQGFNFEEVKLNKTKPTNKVPTFAFAGTFIRTTRNPGPLLEYLSELESDFRFIIYTKDAQLVLPYIKSFKHKIEIRDYIPRPDLLFILSQMDFLVNIGYDPATQSPSKLIDYAFAKRPVLNIDSGFNKNIVEEFIAGDYSKQMVIPDVEKYNIKNVACKFLDLTSNPL